MAAVTTLDVLDSKAALEARLPDFDNPKKVEYLVLRSVMFTHTEALVLIGETFSTFTDWCQNDYNFAQWSKSVTSIRLLQSKVADAVLRAKFLRNVFLQLNIDSELLTKRMMSPEELTKEERTELLQASQRYSATNISSMLKVLEPERKDNEDGVRRIELVVQMGDAELNTFDSNRAAARKLLQDFSTPAPLQGEYKVVE